MKNLLASVSTILCMSCSVSFADATNPYYTLPYPVDVECIVDNLEDAVKAAPQLNLQAGIVGTIADEHSRLGHKFQVLATHYNSPRGFVTSINVQSENGTMRIETSIQNLIFDQNGTLKDIDVITNNSIMTQSGAFQYQGLTGDTEKFKVTGQPFHNSIFEDLQQCRMHIS